MYGAPWQILFFYFLTPVTIDKFSIFGMAVMPLKANALSSVYPD